MFVTPFFDQACVYTEWSLHGQPIGLQKFSFIRHLSFCQLPLDYQHSRFHSELVLYVCVHAHVCGLKWGPNWKREWGKGSSARTDTLLCVWGKKLEPFVWSFVCLKKNIYIAVLINSLYVFFFFFNLSLIISVTIASWKKI